MIEIQGLKVSYKTKNEKHLALNNINFSMSSNEIVAFIGPSGCGKSTLLYVLSGIINNYEGNVLINGEKLNPKKQKIGLILQNYGLLPWKNIYQNAILGLDSKSVKSDGKYIDYILEVLGLKKLLKRYPGEISGGQRQRAAIARSFILKPDLLLMDEPFSALDAMTREDMQGLFLKVWHENKVPSFFITHSIEEAIYIGKKIVILSKSPGSILRTIENPLFAASDIRLKKEYYEMLIYLRKLIKEDWSN
jgi:NitT/TauT family transport system ATP-binding protein